MEIVLYYAPIACSLVPYITLTEADADFEAVKKAWRNKAKLVHPDVRPGDAVAAKAFQALQLAYEVLRAAEERRSWGG